MDFFKSCRTNVQIAEDILQTPSQVYKCDDRRKRHTLLADLRARDTLCAVVRGRQIWVFGSISDEVASILHTADLEPEPSPDPLSPSTLLEAIEGAITFRHSKTCGAVPLGRWAWLLSGFILRLHAHVANGGALHVTTTTENSTLAPVREVHQAGVGGSVLLAPSVRRAEVVVGTSADEGTVVDGQAWRAEVAAMLLPEGLGMSDDTDWLPVRLLDHSDDETAGRNIVWPAHLCLSETPRSQQLAQEGAWKQWFPSAPHDESTKFKNPWTDAEDWALHASERQQTAQLPTAGSNGDGYAALPTSTSMDLDTLLETSPPFVQRFADQQAIASGIYPTPEDNLMTGGGGFTSQQPSSDNILAANTGDTGGLGGDFLPGSDDVGFNGNSSSSDPPAFNLAQDDLFGDIGMGGMEFGGGEVGEADFDWFDAEANGEADSAPADEDMVMEADDEGGADGLGLVEAESEQQDNVESEHGQPVDPDALIEESHGSEEQLLRPSAADDGDMLDQTQRVILPESALNAPEPEKPLTPLAIKERLLPPPIPASSAVATAVKGPLESRRARTFDPVTFRDGLDFRKYSTEYGPAVATNSNGGGSGQDAPDISLPPKRKKPRPPPDQMNRADLGHGEEQDSESEEDSYESASSVSDAGSDMPPKLPWDNKKRKRGDVDEMLVWRDLAHSEHDESGRRAGGLGEGEMQAVLELLTRGCSDGDASDWLQKSKLGASDGVKKESKDPLPSVQETWFPLGPTADLVYIAGVVSEQAVTCTSAIVQALDILKQEVDYAAPAAGAVRTLTESILTNFLPDVEHCDINRLAITRDPSTNRAAPPSSLPTSTRTAGQPPRPPPQRADSIVPAGPDITALPAPYVRVQRGADTFEMLAPALNFWSEFSLAPVNGAKDVRAFCVYPDNDDLRGLVADFISDIGGAYESCKLGSHVYRRETNEADEGDQYEDGLVPVKEQPEPGTMETVKGVLHAYADACDDLGRFLARVGSLEPERTIVVYMVDPFSSAELEYSRARQHLCRAFWCVYKAYRDNVPKAHRELPRSDIVLQLIPIELVAQPGAMVVLDAGQWAALAKEVYDRCPPVLDDAEGDTSALPNYAAPFVELACPPPKRISFQLTAEPPADLLHEGSAMHVAYAFSPDGLWMAVAWVDSTGRYQSSEVYWMQGTTFANVAEEVWERTMEIIEARAVTWRIFIVTAGEVEASYKKCWKQIVSRTRRKQAFSVTLLAANVQPELALSPPTPTSEAMAPGGQAPGAAGFLTPASTPLGNSVTVSPETSNGFNAPLTPAPSDSATLGTADADAEAFYVDLRDESWSVLFTPTFASTALSSQSGALATGALFKRGDDGLESGKPGGKLPSLAVGLLWTVQVRPNGNVDEGNVRQSEMTLREVLRMWRSLSVLTKARGLGEARTGDVAPVHLVAALRAAEGLDGFLEKRW